MDIIDLRGDSLLSEVVNNYAERKHSATKCLIIKELSALIVNVCGRADRSEERRVGKECPV